MRRGLPDRSHSGDDVRCETEVDTVQEEVKDLVIPAGIIDVWQQLVDCMADTLSVPSVMINRLEPPELEVFRSNVSVENPFPSGTRMQMAGVYCATAAMKRRKLMVSDARADPEWADSPTAEAGIYAYLGYPLLWPDGEVFGTICAVDTKTNRWGRKYEKLLLTIKNVIEMHLMLVNTLHVLDDKNSELAHTLAEVKTLRGLLPICASCKKVRDDEGYWRQIESYVRERSHVEFTHGLCPECAEKLYPGLDV